MYTKTYKETMGQIHTFYINIFIIVNYYADISIYTHKSENRYDFLNCDRVEALRLWILNEFHTYGPKKR